MVKHVITLYYQPTDDAKKYYDSLLESGRDVHFVNSGSLKGLVESDEWVKKHVEFDCDCEDNISKYNSHLCELTTFYYIWKNLLDGMSDDDYIQHSHYRKFLDVGKVEQDIDCYITFPYRLVFNIEGIRRDGTIETGTWICHPRPSWEIMKNVVLAESTYKESELWNEWKGLSVLPAPMNMFSMKVKHFKEFMEWLFPLVMEIERRIPYHEDCYKTAYQKRALAFIGERMFSFWCYCQYKKGMKFKQVRAFLFDGFKPITDSEERRIKI